MGYEALNLMGASLYVVTRMLYVSTLIYKFLLFMGFCVFLMRYSEHYYNPNKGIYWVQRNVLWQILWVGIYGYGVNCIGCTDAG